MKRTVSIILAVLLALGFTAACERTVTNTEVVTQPSPCFECHSDENTFIVAADQQYQYSVHASGLNVDRGSSSSCVACHASDGFVAKVTGQPVVGVDDPTAIHCFTCHAPHTNGDLSLRVTAATALQNGVTFDLGKANICVYCHQSRRNVNTYITDPEELSEHWGPHHSNQGDVLIGTNGYEYDWYDYEQTGHRGATANGCLDCHFDVRNSSALGGHSFNMSFDHEGTVRNNVAACAKCHVEAEDDDVVTDFDFKNRAQTVTDSLITELRTRLFAAGVIDDEDHPLDVTVSADSAGAVWNVKVATEDHSKGIHNPRYVQGLLESAIMYWDGLAPSPPSPVATRERERQGAGQP